LADSYVTRVTNEFAPTSLVAEAEQNARRAIELDEIAEAHVSLGLINALHRYQWREAERHFHKALSIKRSADTLNYYCLRLLLSLKRFEEAETIAKEAYSIESDIEKDRTALAATLYFSGRHSEAIGECKRMIDLDGDRWVTYTWLGTAYTHIGSYDLAIKTYKKAMELDSSSVDFVSGWLAYTEILAGKPEAARKELKKLLHLRRTGQRYVSPYTIAVIYNGFGDSNEALEWLFVGYDERIGRMARLAVDPFFVNLRSDTRFRSLLAKLNLDDVTPFTTRPARLIDADFLLEAKRLAYRQYVDKMGTWSDDTHRIKIAAIPLANIQIIQVEGNAIGWFNVMQTENHIELFDIYIIPSHQRRKIGTRIVEKLMDEAAAKQVVFQLVVLKVNPKARDLYIKLGMKEIGQTETHHRLTRQPTGHQ